MPEASNRKFQVLGAAWLGFGALAFAIVLLALSQFLFANAQGTELEDGFWNGVVFVLVLLVLGSIPTVTGLALLRRNRVARPLLIASSLVILPSAAFVVPLLVVAPSLWLALSRSGKEAFESYIARPSG